MRVKRGVTAHKRHQKIRKATKGMTRGNRSSIKRGKQAVTKSLQYAYQDPGASLDPRWKIGSSLHEPLVIHTDLDQAAREKRIRSILEAVGLPDTHLDLYPHEISGGQQRRVGLARIPEHDARR